VLEEAVVMRQHAMKVLTIQRKSGCDPGGRSASAESSTKKQKWKKSAVDLPRYFICRQLTATETLAAKCLNSSGFENA